MLQTHTKCQISHITITTKHMMQILVQTYLRQSVIHANKIARDPPHVPDVPDVPARYAIYCTAMAPGPRRTKP